jgi:hypothetical protein
MGCDKVSTCERQCSVPGYEGREMRRNTSRLVQDLQNCRKCGYSCIAPNKLSIIPPIHQTSVTTYALRHLNLVWRYYELNHGCLTAEIGRRRATDIAFLTVGFWCLNISTAGTRTYRTITTVYLSLSSACVAPPSETLVNSSRHVAWRS